jgi:hypothetical protein
MGTPNGDQSNAGGIFDQARTTVQNVVDRQVTARMSEAATVIANVADTIREIALEVEKRKPSEPLASFAKTIVTRLDASAAYLRTTKPAAAFADMNRAGGEHPVTASLIAIAAGYGAARVLKVSLKSDVR